MERRVERKGQNGIKSEKKANKNENDAMEAMER